MAPKDDDAKKRPRRHGQDRGVPGGEQGWRRLVAHVLTYIYARLLSSIAGMIYAEYRSRRKSIGAPGPAAAKAQAAAEVTRELNSQNIYQSSRISVTCLKILSIEFLVSKRF